MQTCVVKERCVQQCHLLHSSAHRLLVYSACFLELKTLVRASVILVCAAQTWECKSSLFPH